MQLTAHKSIEVYMTKDKTKLKRFKSYHYKFCILQSNENILWDVALKIENERS
jgi:hypothetical protein